MQRYEFHVVPAPRRGEKARSARTTEERFALTLTSLMNSLGQEGWDYVRADTLPCDERSGLTGTKTSFQNVLVFRRLLRGLGEDLPDRPAMKIFSAEPATAAPKLGPAETPQGTAPAIGPANSGVATE